MCGINEHIFNSLKTAATSEKEQMNLNYVLSFYFCKSSTCTSDLIKCIKEKISAVHTAGFHVVGTIRDQGSTNRAAINYLLEETNELFFAGEENTYRGFLIDDIEV